MQQTMHKTDQGTFVWHKDNHLPYGLLMAVILTVGFLGNVTTLLVLKEREHRRRGVAPLIINLALADIFIIAFGYSIALQANVCGEQLKDSHYVWVGFINGTVGIASIFTLTEMGVASYYGLKHAKRSIQFSVRQIIYLTGLAWMYGGLCMLPPLLGWNRFVLSASEIGCGPDWVGRSYWDTIYNILLVILGFFVPFMVMVICYLEIYSTVNRTVIPVNEGARLRWRYSKLKIVRITAVSTVAFLLSWSPYCFISIATIFAGSHVITAWKVEVAELMAKASVMYAPVIYIITYNRFRATLFRILHLRRRRNGTAPEHLTSLTLSNRHRSARGRHNWQGNCTEFQRLRISYARRRLSDPSTKDTVV